MKKTIRKCGICVLLCVVSLWCFSGFCKAADDLVFKYCEMFASRYQDALMEAQAITPPDVTLRGTNRQNRFLPSGGRRVKSDVYWVCDFKIGGNAYTAHLTGFYYAVSESSNFFDKKVYNRAVSNHTQGDVIQMGGIDVILGSGRRKTPVKVYIAITQFYKSGAGYPFN